MAHKWARWLHNPYRLGGSPALRRGGRNQRWPTSGQGGYITRAAWGVPTASERGAESEVAHKWARWLHNPYRVGGPHRFREGGRIRGGPQVGKVATKPVPRGGSPPLQRGGRKTQVAHKWARWLHNPPLQRGGRNQRWPTSGQGGYITRTAWGVPTASERGAESEVAHKWARWLHNPYRVGGPHSFREGGGNRGGPQVGKVAT